MGSGGQVNVFLPGYVFATILNAAAKSKNLQDGLLFGECNSQLVSTISDSQQDSSHQVEEITVQDAHINHSLFSFYDSLGAINEKQFVTKLCEKDEKFVGYYSIRRNTNASISLRERTLLKNLLKTDMFQNKKLLFLLFTPSCEENMATYNFNYKGFIFTPDCTPASAKVNVINLGSGDQKHEYMQKSRLLGSRENPTTRLMKQLQESESDRFMTETGSVKMVDHSYVLFHKTIAAMESLQANLVSHDKMLEECSLKVEQLEEIVSNNSPEKT